MSIIFGRAGVRSEATSALDSCASDGYPIGMKAVFSALLMFAATLGAGDYKKDFADLKAKVAKEKMDAHLADWRAREPENPDAWIHSSNRDYLLDEIFGEQRRRHYREKFRQVDNRE